MEFTDILQLSIVGFFVSLLVQYLKARYETQKTETLVILGGVSVIASVAFHFITSQGLLETVLPVLVTASAIHNLIIRQFEEK